MLHSEALQMCFRDIINSQAPQNGNSWYRKFEVSVAIVADPQYDLC